MIGDKTRDFLKAIAGFLILFGVLQATLLIPQAIRVMGMAGSSFHPWGALLSIFTAFLGPAVQAGILLTLLSIDERIQNRGQ